MTDSSPTAPTPTEPTPTILVIDDDPGFVKILTIMNRIWRLPLAFCTERHEIQRALEAPGAYRVVVSDCHVPYFDILDKLRALRAEHPEIELVLMSNLDEQELRGAGAALEPSLVEPKEGIVRQPDAFAERIRQLLDRHAG
jgi:DNA-binding NtrC family response regulator